MTAVAVESADPSRELVAHAEHAARRVSLYTLQRLRGRVDDDEAWPRRRIAVVAMRIAPRDLVLLLDRAARRDHRLQGRRFAGAGGADQREPQMHGLGPARCPGDAPGM